LQPKIDYTLTADGLLFRTHRDRCLYLGKSRKDRPQWLKENAGNYWRIDDLQIEPDRLVRPAQSQGVTLAPAQPISEPASSDIRRHSVDADVATAPRPAENCTAKCPPTLPPPPVKSSAPPQPKPLPYTKPAVDDTERPKVAARPVEATAPNQERGGPCRPKEQNRHTQRRNTRSKAAQRLLAKRMLIVIETLTERPIYRYAAEKAGVHRKTLEYWLKCSKSGNEGYEIEWQGFSLPFHEHCETAIDIARDKLLTVVLEIAKGVRLKTDEDGNLIEEVVGPPNGKMIRFFLELVRPEVWGKYRKIDHPQTGGVLVLGDSTKQPATCPSASINVRQWKSGWNKVRKAGA
jgi:hypothetical protein